MYCRGQLKNVAVDWKSQEYILTFATKQDIRQQIEEIQDAELDIQADIHREKRSNNANRYLWKLCTLIAEKVGGGLTKDDVYLSCLEDYGQYQICVIKEEALPKMKRLYKTISVDGKIWINGQEGIQIKCYYGSHLYDSYEMAKLLDGVVAKCHELKISTLPPEEIERLEKAWKPNV